MQAFNIEVVRGWHVVSAASGRIVGVFRTQSQAQAQVAAIELKRNAPKTARASVK